MRKILLMMILGMMFSATAYAVVVPNYITGNTVAFNATEAHVVTFNTATRHINIRNESLSEDVYVDFRCKDNNGKEGHATNTTVALVKLSHAGGDGVTGSTIDLEFATTNLGFLSDSGIGTLTYWVTGDRELE